MKLLKNKTKNQPKKPKKNQTAENYKKFCYTIIGKQFDKPDKFKNLGEQLNMANMKYTPPLFLSIITITTILISIISILIYIILFKIIIQTPSWIIYATTLTLITSLASFLFLFLVMKMRISTRKLQIDRNLPFALSELSVIASTGLTPIKIIRHMAKRGSMAGEFKKIVHKIDIEGKDIVTAISETAKDTPSTAFREALWDLSNMIHQGGDLDEYLRQKADHTMQLRRDIQREFIEKLGTYSEMYVSLVLIGVLFIGIAAFLMDAMGSTAMGLDADTLLMLLAYGIIPLAVVMVTVILSTAYMRNG